MPEEIEQVKQIGVDEVACLIDFGVDDDAVLSGLVSLNEVKQRSNRVELEDEPDYSIAQQSYQT